MRVSIRRLAALATSAVVAGAVVSGPAAAQNRDESYLGSAAATALSVNLLGASVTLGDTKATADSQLTAKADGAGQLLAPATVTTAEAVGDGQKQDSGEKCGPVTLPAEISSILAVATACSSSSAAVAGGMPVAKSNSIVAAVDLSANTVLSQPIAPVQDALEQIFGALPDALDPVTDTVGELVDAVASTQTLAVRLGAASSDVTTTAQKVTSKGTAAAGQIDILPVGGLQGAPLASIIVSSATATAVYDRAQGVASTEIDPALVTVKLNLPGGVPVSQEIKVTPGQSVKILEGTPLESEIIVAAGTTETDEATGAVKAIADGVRLKLLTGVNGGVVLDLAHAEAGVVGSPAIAELSREVTELPRTGGSGPWLPIAGAGLVGLALISLRATRLAAVRSR